MLGRSPFKPAHRYTELEQMVLGCGSLNGQRGCKRGDEPVLNTGRQAQ